VQGLDQRRVELRPRIVRPSELLTNTVPMPAARARAAMALTSPPSLFGSSQIHIPLPANGAGSGPPGARRCAGTGSTMSRITRDRRPARSVTRTEIVPALVPGGTRATHPARERLSLVASAPFDQRKLTRIPALRPVPPSCTYLPIMTCGRGWQTARVAGTHRSPVSFGGGLLAWAAVGAIVPASRAAMRRLRAASW
jgi:hypothetical protein